MESGDFHTGNYTCSSLTDIDDGNEFYLYSLYAVSGWFESQWIRLNGDKW